MVLMVMGNATGNTAVVVVGGDEMSILRLHSATIPELGLMMNADV